jgi:type I restriction enzyme S subunit
VGFVTIMGRSMATSQDFVNWVCGPGLDPRFLMYLLIANRQEIRDLGSGAVHQTVYFPTVESFSVCVPAINEQQRIAANIAEQLAAADAAKRAANERLAAAEALTAAYLRDVFDGAKVTQWSTKTLAEVVRRPIRTGISKPGGPDSQKRCLTLSAVRGRTLVLEASKPVDVSDSEADGNWVRPGCFYVIRGNGNRELVGRGAFAPDDLGDSILFPDLLFELDLRDEVDRAFFWCQWSSAAVRMELANRARTAAGIYKINTSNLNSVPLLLPTLDEQRVVAAELLARLDATDLLRIRCRDDVATTSALPGSLLRTAFARES